MSKFYVTTAIDYPNGAPHMGHAYEKIVTDVYARWYRFMGIKAFFLTGTDENGQKLVKAAAEKNTPTKNFVDANVELFKKLCIDLNLSNDDFIRTTDERHHRVAQELWTAIEKAGDIYFGRYEGWYCSACEAFYLKTQAPDLKCPEHFVPLEHVEEEGYFFRLGKYQKWILETIQAKPDFVVPASSRNEVLRRIEKEEFKDLSISRPNAGWGIPVPGQPKFVMYTWFDALINYYTATRNPSGREHLWPADMHVIGKDISWFHAVIWPCMLKSAGIEMPKQIYVHGMVLGQDGRKMSKSLGNGVDPYAVIDKLPLDSFRYYLLRAIPSGLDGAFVTGDLIGRHNSELANDYGNLMMRVIKLGAKKLGQSISVEGVKSDLNFAPLGETMHAMMEKREHHLALEHLWAAVNEANMYITRSEPWKLEGNDPRFKQIIYNGLYAIHCFGCLIAPFLPGIGEKTLAMLGTRSEGASGLAFGKHHFQLGEAVALFPKIESAGV